MNTMQQSDIKLARKYLSKASSSKDRGLSFELPFNEYKKLVNRKRCYFTNMSLCPLTLSLDRIDNTLGYVSGNVVACHTTFNALKAIIENPNNDLTFKNVIRGLKKV